ncbi:unnamed protein product [Urochloa humidicola]
MAERGRPSLRWRLAPPPPRFHPAPSGGWDATVPADPGGWRPPEPGSAAPDNGTFLTGGEDQTSPPFASPAQSLATMPQASIILLLDPTSASSLTSSLKMGLSARSSIGAASNLVI